MSGDPEILDCAPPTAIGNNSRRIQCSVGGEPYAPPGVDWDYPVSFIHPHPLPATQSLRLRVSLHGYSGAPIACTSDNGSANGFVVINNCAAHYPNHHDHSVGHVLPMGWWGIFGGTDNNGWRIALSITRAVHEFGKVLDMDAGIHLVGTSYGGTGAILQSMILPDPWWRNYISVVQANLPHTLFVKTHYQRDPAVRLAWGDYDTNLASFHWWSALDGVNHIYYRINGATNDRLGVVDLEFFRLCDKHRIACFGTWHQGGHAPSEPGVNLPTALYAAPQQQVRLDRMLPVFTHSSANHWGERGHYNLGLSWHSGQGWVDTATRVELPLRYQRHTSLGGGIPDQPPSATFDLTLRRTQAFALPEGRTVQWSLGGQSGIAEVSEAGELTLHSLTLESSEQYTTLVVEPLAP